MKSEAMGRYRLQVDEKMCKGCQICVETCPCGALAVSGNRNGKGYLMPLFQYPGKCKGCLLCEMICPDLAVWVEEVRDEN